MTANDFFQHFATLADAPGGIQRLRELILNLAIQAKLVPQLPDEGSAVEILKTIRFPERIDLETRRTNGEPPFEIPARWEWVSFGEIMDIQGGTQPPKSQFIDHQADGYVRLLQIRDFGPKPVPVYVRKDSVRRTCSHSDVMLARYGASVGKVFMGQDGAYNVALTKVAFDHEAIHNRFVFHLLQTELFQAHLQNVSRSAQDGFNKGNLHPILLPLPPLAEQKRIVAKVDRLLALCDALEAQQQARHAVRSRLHATLLGNLQTAANAADFARAWQRLRDHFAELFTPGEAALDAVAQLRQTILQLAAQGKLVPQDAEDEPAEAFLRTIGQAGETPGEIEIPFSLPIGWSWIRLGQLGRFCGGGTPSKNNPSFWQGPIPWVSPKDMKTPYIHDVPDHISAEALEQSSAQLIFAESLLMVVRGMILIHTFPTALAKCDLTINQDMKALQLHSPEIGEYLLQVFAGSQPRVLSKIRRSSHGTCRLDSADLSRFLIALPPLAEQQRIVAKVQQLMAQCDALEASLKAAATVSERWSAAAVRRVLERPSRLLPGSQ